MTNNSLLLRTAGNHPSIQVRERSAGISRMYHDPVWMLAAFLTVEKQAICVRLTTVARPRPAPGISTGSSRPQGNEESGGALPVDHDGDPRVLLGVEAQPIVRPAPRAQPHRTRRRRRRFRAHWPDRR